jgi:hypothetical protein
MSAIEKSSIARASRKALVDMDPVAPLIDAETPDEEGPAALNG